MLILAASLLLFLSPTAIALLHFFRRKFRQYWLFCVLAGFIALVLLIFGTFLKPVEINLFVWKPVELFPFSPVLLADRMALMFSAGLTSLILAALLATGTQKTFTRESSFDFPQWLGLLYLASVTIFSLMAGNLLTLMFAWFALDVTELLIWLAISGVNPEYKKLVVNLSIRFTSLFLLLFAGVIAFSAFLPPGFEELTAPVRVLIYAACALRILVLPLCSPLSGGDRKPSLAQNILQVLPFGAYLILLARLAQPAGSEPINAPLLVFLVTLSTGAALLWAFTRGKDSSLPYWLISTSLLSLSASIFGKVEASVVWGLSVIFSGGLLYLYFTRRRTSRLILFFGLFNLSILPLSASWFFVSIFSRKEEPLVYTLLIPLGLILAGYYRFIKEQVKEDLGAERWMVLIYPAGLLLLPVLNLGAVGFGYLAGDISEITLPPLSESWPALVSALLAGLVWVLISKYHFKPSKILSALQNLTSLNWLYRIAGFSLRLLGQILYSGNAVMEGRGGIFWSLLLLTLVFALLYQSLN